MKTIITIIALSLIPIPAWGQATIVSQSGDVNVLLYPYDQGYPDPVVQTVNIPASGDVNVSAEADAAPDFDGFSKQTMTMVQNSYSIALNGTYSGQFIPYAGTSRYTGELTATIVFDIPTDVPFSLSVVTTGEDISSVGDPETAGFVRLNGPNNYSVGGGGFDSAPGYNNYSTDGTLTPGEYTLTVNFASELVPYTAYIHNPNITLILPEPGTVFAMSVLPLAVLRHRRYC